MMHCLSCHKHAKGLKMLSSLYITIPRDILKDAHLRSLDA